MKDGAWKSAEWLDSLRESGRDDAVEGTPAARQANAVVQLVTYSNCFELPCMIRAPHCEHNDRSRHSRTSVMPLQLSRQWVSHVYRFATTSISCRSSSGP